jgi:predicted ATPase
MPQLAAIRYSNYRQFLNAELPLGPLTLLVGANGTGKSTALNALNIMNSGAPKQFDPGACPLSLGSVANITSRIEAVWDDNVITTFAITGDKAAVNRRLIDAPSETQKRITRLRTARIFSFVPERIAEPVPLTKTLELQNNGAGLPAVLTTLQDNHPERFDDFNKDLRRWMPEFDRVLFDTPQQGHRSILLRTKHGGYSVRAKEVSHGTLLGLALLTLCHLPRPPSILGLEEPDRGIHPRLLREVYDSLLRLTTPEAFGDSRPAVQVIVTTHSPYMVDLFRDDLQHVVVTKKEQLEATFVRVADLPDVDEILRGAPLGEAWYSGILGGVPQTA